jgi:hypothetical protein
VTYRRTAASALGWILFALAVAAFLVSLWLFSPIVQNLSAFGLCSGACLFAAFVGWGFAHCNPAQVWRSYFKVALKTLLVSFSIATALYVTYCLMRQSGVLPFEASIGLFVLAMVVLQCLRWTGRHPLLTALLSVAFAFGVALEFSGTLQKSLADFFTSLNIYAALLIVDAVLNPIVMLNGLLLVAFVVWIVFAIRRG